MDGHDETDLSVAECHNKKRRTSARPQQEEVKQCFGSYRFVNSQALPSVTAESNTEYYTELSLCQGTKVFVVLRKGN